LTSWHFVVVTDAIAISVSFTVTTTYAECVKLVAVAVAIAFWDVGTAAFVNGSRSVAHAAFVEFTDARVYVVADAVAVGVGLAWSAALAECVKLVAIAVAIAGRDAFATANTTLVKDVAVAVAVSFRNV